MTAFQYAYIDESGKKLHKVREASSKQQLEKKLAEEGVLLVSVKLHEIASKRIVKRKGKKVPPRELIEFCIYMTMMVEAGVPLTTSLLDFSEETKNENFKNVIKSVHSAIYTGETLSDSLKAYPHIFPQEFV